jgi:predicted nucleic acid-binding protein
MSGAEAFFDSNVLIYLLSDDQAKASWAEELLGRGGTISVQVLNEITNVARRKCTMPWPEIRELLATVRALCAVVPVSEATHELGLAVAERYGFSIYDGLIIAAASLAGCSLLYSEDLQDGQTVHDVTILNPFRSAIA